MPKVPERAEHERQILRILACGEREIRANKGHDLREKSGLTRLTDAQKQTNSLESRFDLAYNAAHALCLAALRHSGYRCHDVRNRGEYEGGVYADERLVADLITACKAVGEAVEKLKPL
ncbi:MAG TPA: hypothetical protein VGM22_27620 [Methylomirabilota bacterium]|jgi:hypothetical protein